MKQHNRNLRFDFDIQESNAEEYYVNSIIRRKKTSGVFVKNGAILLILYILSFVVLFATMALFNYFFKIDSIIFGIVLFVIAYIISYVPMVLYLIYVYISYFSKRVAAEPQQNNNAIINA